MVTTRRIDIGAVNLVVDEAGEGGRPLLLVHGYGGARRDFGPLIEPLAERGWHVVAPDQRGHGDSDDLNEESAYSFASFAGDLLELLAALGWDEIVLLGHSMGGMVAQTFALAAPDRLRGLILMDTTHKDVRMDPELVALAAKVARENGMATIVEMSRDIDDPLETAAHRRLCETVPGYREFGDEKQLACDPLMYAAMAIEITTPHDRLGRLAAIDCPTLVIVGEQDAPFIKPSQRDVTHWLSPHHADEISLGDLQKIAAWIERACDERGLDVEFE